MTSNSSCTQSRYDIINVNREKSWAQYTPLFDSSGYRKGIAKCTIQLITVLHIRIPIYEYMKKAQGHSSFNQLQKQAMMRYFIECLSTIQKSNKGTRAMLAKVVNAGFQ